MNMKTNSYVQFLSIQARPITERLLQAARWIGKSVSVFLGRTRIAQQYFGHTIQYTTESVEMRLKRCFSSLPELKVPSSEVYLFKRSATSVARPRLATANDVGKVDEGSLRRVQPIVAKALSEDPYEPILIENDDVLSSITSSLIRNIRLKHPIANGSELTEIAEDEMLGANAKQYWVQAKRLMSRH